METNHDKIRTGHANEIIGNTLNANENQPGDINSRLNVNLIDSDRNPGPDGIQYAGASENLATNEGNPNQKTQLGNRGWHGNPQGHAQAGRKGGVSVSQNKEHMANIGRKGGETVSRDRNHMAEIGRKGGVQSRKSNNSQNANSDTGRSQTGTDKNLPGGSIRGNV